MEQQEVKVTGGIGWFFFALIPGALAGALLMYLAFYTGVIDWEKAQRIEGRMDNRVGVNGQLTAPVNLLFHGKGCIDVDRAYLDSGVLTVYLHNKCGHQINDIEYASRALAPDGTTIVANGNYLPGTDNMLADEKREITLGDLDTDSRVATVTFTISEFQDLHTGQP